MTNKLQPQDIRYGNLIEFDSKIFTVKEIGRYIVTANRGKGDVDFTYNEINPVPLTEDWLLRAGFEKKGEFWFIKDGIKIERLQIGFVYYRFSTIIHIKYLNQLQNFFHSLTAGQELEINTK